MLSNMRSHHVAVLWRCVIQNPLDQVITVLVAGNVDKRDSSPVAATLADSIEISAQKIPSANLETLLYHFGSELIGAVLRCVPDYMIDGSASVWRSSVFTDVLNAPVAKLTMGDNVDIGEDFFNAWTLRSTVSVYGCHKHFEQHTLSSSRQFSKMFCTTRLPVSPKATSCHMPRRASLTYFMICGGDSVQRSSKSFCQT